MEKPIHARPSLYAYYFQILKEIAQDHGYNLVLHGSLNRDMDLIAIPWQQTIKPYHEMMDKFMEVLGGRYLQDSESITYHGRIHYVINLNRGEYQYFGKDDKDPFPPYHDPQYYIDISIMPVI
jgi:hypothetical protein